MKKIKLKIISMLVYLIIYFIYLTNKKIYHHATKDGGKAFIFCMWHEDFFFQSFNYFRFRKKGKIKSIASHHKDGEIAVYVMEKFGIGAIRGSSSKGAIKVALQAIKALKSGYDVAITPDGPRGPRRIISDGVIFIAQKAKVDIICLNSVPTKYWVFNSWDRAFIPKPFGTIHFYLSEPINVQNKNLENIKIELNTRMLEHSLNSM